MPKVDQKSRQVKTRQYSSFRLGKRIKHEKTDIPNVYKIFEQSLRLLKSQWKLFSMMLVIYMLLTVVIVGGLALGSDVQGLKNEAAAEQMGALVSGLAIFQYLVTNSSGAATEAGSVYQFFLIVIFSLVSLWALRQVQAGKKISVKQSFYNSTYPLVPFLLVLFVIVIQLLPLLIGTFLYGAVVSGGIAVEALEKLLWGTLSGLLALLSLYMVSSSVFALYIVTLPDIQPMQALRSARELVRHRRFLVMRKVIALPFILLLLMAAIVIPLIIVFALLAEIVFFVLSMAVLLVVHSYIYTLYRELL